MWLTEKQEKVRPTPKYITKSTAARRPRPPRDGARKKHVPRVSPYSTASIDLGFEETGLVQLPPSLKTANVTLTPYTADRQTDRKTDRQTDRQTDSQTDRQTEKQINQCKPVRTPV